MAHLINLKGTCLRFEEQMYEVIKKPSSPASITLNLKLPPFSELGRRIIGEGSTSSLLKVTKSAFDIRIQGKGFLSLQLSNGTCVYTRNGSFKINPEGYLVHKSFKKPYITGGEKPTKHDYLTLTPKILIASNSQGVQISPEGQVSFISSKNKSSQDVGQIKLVDFINPAGLRSLGQQLYLPTSESGPPKEGRPGEGELGLLAQGELDSPVSITDKVLELIQLVN